MCSHTLIKISSRLI